MIVGAGLSAGSQSILPRSTTAPKLTFTTPAGFGAKTYLGPDRLLEFRYNVLAAPYDLAAYVQPDGSIFTEAYLVVAAGKADINGAIVGPFTNEVTMACFDSDVNGSSLQLTGSSTLVAGQNNQSALAIFDLNDLTGAGITPYYAGYPKKKMIAGGDGTLYWGTNLGVTPKASADTQLGRIGANRLGMTNNSVFNASFFQAVDQSTYLQLANGSGAVIAGGAGGATLLQLDATAGVGSILLASVGGATKLEVLQSGQVKTIAANETTGAASALLGANSPATVVAAPYRWLRFTASDGTAMFVPAWK